MRLPPGRRSLSISSFSFYLLNECACARNWISDSQWAFRTHGSQKPPPRRHPGTPGPENRALPVFHELEYTEGFRYLRYFQHVSAQFQDGRVQNDPNAIIGL